MFWGLQMLMYLDATIAKAYFFKFHVILCSSPISYVFDDLC